MISKDEQRQSVENGSLAIQSGRDTVINSASAVEQFTELLRAMRGMIHDYIKQSEDKAAARFQDFEESLLRRLAAAGENARVRAFSDPDFQYQVRQAVSAHVRYGEQELRDVLIDLIVKRSERSGRDRLTLTLNDAIETAPSLTVNEISELTMSFIIRYVQSFPTSVEGLAAFLRTHLVPLLPTISNENSSYVYLARTAVLTSKWAKS